MVERNRVWLQDGRVDQRDVRVDRVDFGRVDAQGRAEQVGPENATQKDGHVDRVKAAFGEQDFPGNLPRFFND